MPLSGNERRFLGHPALSLVTILTELSLLPYGYLTNYARSSHIHCASCPSCKSLCR